MKWAGGGFDSRGHLNKHEADAEHRGRVCKHETGVCVYSTWADRSDDGGALGHAPPFIFLRDTLVFPERKDGRRGGAFMVKESCSGSAEGGESRTQRSQTAAMLAKSRFMLAQAGKRRSLTSVLPSLRLLSEYR